MLDLSVDNQLAGVFGMEPGLFLPTAYPYVTESGAVFQLAVFQAGAVSPRRSMLNWESEVMDSYSTGTVGIASGVVTGSGTAFPAFTTNPVYKRRLYIGDQWYEVATRDNGTQLTLVNTAVNVSAGTSYKYTAWEYRENNPFYAITGEFQFAQDEAGNVLNQIRSLALASGGRPGWYEYPCSVFWREANRIADSLAAWQTDLDATLNYTTASGFKIIDVIRELGGEVYWNNYVPDAYLVSSELREKWLRRNQNIMESLADRNVPNRPLFRPLTLDGVEEFEPTGVGTKVPDDYQLEMLDAVFQFQGHQIAVWGTKSTPGSGSVSEWDASSIALFEGFNRSLPWSAHSGATFTPAQSAVFSPAQLPLIFSGV